MHNVADVFDFRKTDLRFTITVAIFIFASKPRILLTTDLLFSPQRTTQINISTRNMKEKIRQLYYCTDRSVIS